jgi:hypothetical protein
MGLESTSIPDRDGAAVYFLYDSRSNTETVRRVETTVAELDRQAPDNDIEMVDIHSANGERVRSFYSIPLESLPIVLVIRDDDTLFHQWTLDQLPSVNEVLHMIRTIGGTGRMYRK